jgi:hypothetical protein
MKKILLSFLLLLFVTSLAAQNQKVRVGLFKKWYIGTFEEVRGNYSIAIDTISDIYDLYEEEDEGFWSEQYDYHYLGIYDSLRVTIKSDVILYDNSIFDNVYTIKAIPKHHYYYMAALNDRNRTLFLIMYPEGTSGWQIVIRDTEKQGWGGIWEKVTKCEMTTNDSANRQLTENR